MRRRAQGSVSVRPDVEPEPLIPTDKPPMEMVGVLTGTGTGTGTLTVVEPPEELPLGVLVGVPAGVLSGRAGSVVPVVVGNGSEGIDGPVEPRPPVTDPTVLSTGASALTTGFKDVPPPVVDGTGEDRGGDGAGRKRQRSDRQ
jgi:hypothetical protein